MISRILPKALISIQFLLISIFGLSQERLSGLIVDSSGNPVPFAHVQVLNTNYGTIANHEGRFQLILETNQEASLKISCIGYKSKVVHGLNDEIQVVLEEDIHMLSEVAVVPRDYAREVVEKAIENIPINYPEVAEIHVGFAREHAYWDSLKTEPLYVAETVLESYKLPYTKAQRKGDVRLVEGRKYEDTRLDSLAVRFYGGSHDAHTMDVVANRAEFFSNPEKYFFELADTIKFDSKDVFEISFSHKSRLSGSVFIVDSSFAVLKANFHHYNYPKRLIRGSRRYNDYFVEYSQKEGKWRMSNAGFQTAFDFGDRELYIFSEYATTNIRIDENGINYTDRIQYGDVFLSSTGEYDSTFWKNYNIILPDSNTEELFSKSPSRKDASEDFGKKRTLLEILKKFRSSFTLEYAPISVDQYFVSFSNSEFTLTESNEGQDLHVFSIASAFQYQFKNSWFMGLNSNITLSKNSNSFMDLQLLREINLNPRGRPIFISPGISFGYQQISKLLGNFKSNANFKINGKTFDSGSTDILLQQKGFRFMPVLSLGIEKSHRLQYFISAGYNVQINQKIGLVFDETDQFFLKQKKAFLENGDEGLVINTTNQLFENNWNLSFGIYLSL